ncbi:MAG: DNA-binding protein WhiA [Candidatus Eremiobacteraeota bacterium]|nr:DNA-binding protein WhiA [Candidatus Eremiobacteraeota bacterium]
MKFAKEIKSELYGIIPKKRCCARAQLWAMLSKRIKDISSPANLKIKAESIPEARLLVRLIRKFTSQEINWSVEGEKRLVPHQVIWLELQLTGELKNLLSLGNLKTGKAKNSLVSRKCCMKSFMRGIFLIAGSVSTGKSGYHLEFNLKTKDSSNQVFNILQSLGHEPKTGKRRKNHLVYMKKGEEISSFLPQVGAFKGMLKFEEERALKETRGHVNRLVNSDAANLEKQAIASARQVRAIEKIRGTGLWKRLPYSLRELGEMRVLHPELSLAELGEKFSPVIKKATVSRRLRRLEDTAENIQIRRNTL